MGEHALYLVRREGDPLAETVDRISQPLFGDPVHCRQHDLVDIGVSPASIFRRHCVRSKIARPHPNLAQLRQPPCRPQHLQFVVHRQPVSGLDLDGRHAFRDQRVQPGQGGCDKLVLAQRPCRRDGRDDAASGPRDLFIAGSFEPHLEFFRPIAAEDQMGMAVDRRRRDQSSAEILASDVMPAGGNRIPRGNERDPPALDTDHMVVANPVAGAGRHGRNACAGEDGSCHGLPDQ